MKTHASAQEGRELALDPAERLVLEDTQAWLVKAVIGLGLCPFAHAVHSKNQIRTVVCWAAEDEEVLRALEREVEHLQQTDPVQCETTLLVAPNCCPEFLDFAQLIAQAQRLLKRLRVRDEFQLAHFHPQYQFANTNSQDAQNWTNRSPYPTLHLLRVDSVEAALEKHPDPEGIFKRNMELLNELGAEGFEALGLASRCEPRLKR